MTYLESVAYLESLPDDEQESAEERIAIRVDARMTEQQAVRLTAQEIKKRHDQRSRDSVA